MATAKQKAAAKKAAKARATKEAKEATAAVVAADVEIGEANDAEVEANVAEADSDASAIEEEAGAIADADVEMNVGLSPEKSEEDDPKKEKEALVKVRPVRGYMFEPFQRVAIPEGVKTPLVRSQWVQCQIDAGLLKEC